METTLLNRVFYGRLSQVWFALAGCLVSALLGPIEIGGFAVLLRAFVGFGIGMMAALLYRHISRCHKVKEADALTFETQVQGLGSRSRKGRRRTMI